jgi:hypothetical protein
MLLPDTAVERWFRPLRGYADRSVRATFTRRRGSGGAGHGPAPFLLNVMRDNSGAIGRAGIHGRRVSKRTSKRRGELAELAFLLKAASCLRQGVYFITTQRCCNGVAIPYTAAEIDFLAAHVFPRERGEHGMYADYREAWCQMGCGREVASAAGLTIERRCASGRPSSRMLPDACPLRTRPAIKPLPVP